ncbi:unnamed protein product [Vicia faba]|uniref:Uncharacterized protein n=1 Tax=Vicia faba TaxID=3906 RepID=A0AAV0Z0K5_VICFA|nr:unnamed protein product [Vicia faba]
MSLSLHPSKHWGYNIPLWAQVVVYPILFVLALLYQGNSYKTTLPNKERDTKLGNEALKLQPLHLDDNLLHLIFALASSNITIYKVFFIQFSSHKSLMNKNGENGDSSGGIDKKRENELGGKKENQRKNFISKNFDIKSSTKAKTKKTDSH